jgi:Fuc2NAc and GlcNAc transferase
LVRAVAPRAPLTVYPLALVVFAATAVSTYLVKRAAEARQVLDVPNARSSHRQPTPRGGGVAICLAAFAAALWLWSIGILHTSAALGFVVGGVLVACIGAVDDVRGTHPASRLAVHLVAAIIATIAIDQAPSLRDQLMAVRLLRDSGSVFVLVWAINSFNFMDGIDGLAASECTVITMVGGSLLLSHAVLGLGFLSIAIGAASLGFLIWNWQPAKIFMGDVGSGFLGFAIGYLALASGPSGGPSVAIWAILAGLFLVDASLTLLRRMARGEHWWSAHRSHAYQRAATALGQHGPVTLASLLLDIPLALLAIAAARGWWSIPAAGATAAVGLLAVYAGIERRAPMARTGGRI